EIDNRHLIVEPFDASEMVFVRVCANKPSDPFVLRLLFQLANDLVRILLTEIAVDDGEVVGAMFDVKHVTISYGKALNYRHRTPLAVPLHLARRVQAAAVMIDFLVVLGWCNASHGASNRSAYANAGIRTHCCVIRSTHQTSM